MKTSESLKNLAPALLKAQAKITFAAKDATNPHFKNKYADLSAVIEAIKPALNENGISYLQTGSPSEDGRLHLTTRLQHESGEWIEDTLTMPLPKQDPQGYGSAMTYARRYSLAAITGLYQDDDDGNGAAMEARPNELPKLLERAKKAAGQGIDAYKHFWTQELTDSQRALVGDTRHQAFKQQAADLATQP